MPPRAVGEAHPPKLERAWNPIVSSLSHEVGGSVSVGSPIDILLSDKIRFRLGAGLRKERPVHKLSRVASILASTAALVVIVAWLAFCKIHRSDRRATGLVQRHLSDYGEENDLESILEGCLELREELGLSQDVSEPDEPPEAKKARLFLMLRESGEAFERARENSLQPLQAGARGLTHESSAREQSQLLGGHTLNYSSQGEMSRSEGTAWLPAAAPKRKSARRRISNDSLGSASTRVIPSPSASPKVSISARLASSPRASSGSDAKGQSPEDWLSRDVEGSSPKAEEQGPPGGQSLHNSPIRMGLTDCPEDASTSEAAVHTGASFESDDGGAAGYNSSKVAEQGAHKLASDQQLLQQESLARDGAQQEENVVDSTTGAEQDAGKLASDQQLLQEETLEREGEQQEENVVDSSTDAEQGGAKLASEQELLQEETLVRGEGTLVRDGAQSEESVVDSSMAADSTMDAEQGTAKMASVQELLQEETLVREGAQQAEERVDDVGDVLQPSTSAGQMVANVISEEELAAEGRDSFHPFVRLPKVSPKNVTKTFDGFGAFVSKIPKGGPMSNFLSMRELFAKPSLNAKDVQQLMADCTGLVAYACKKLAGPPSRTNAFYIVRKLASMVMVFDYVVSTLVLLGKKMDAKIWWSDFVGRFHTDFNFEPRTNTQRVTEGIVELIQQLSAALTIYKTGKRPSNGTVIQLKRDILSNLRNSCIFENPSWILWEEDDSRFKQTSASSKK